MQQIIKLSINKSVINKAATREDWVALSSQLSPIEMLTDEIITHLCTHGYPICCADLHVDPKSGFAKRNGDAFKSAQIVGLDIDNGKRSWDEIKEDPYFNKYAAFAYTTASHTAENPRMRVMFVTEEPIRNPKDYKAITTALAERFDGDTNARDAVRIWFGAKNATVEAYGNILTMDQIADMIDGHEEARDLEIAFNAFGGQKPNVDEIRAMLKVIPKQQDHIQWKKVCAAVSHAVGDDVMAARILDEWSPCTGLTNYRDVLKNKLTRVTTATLYYYARLHGYDVPKDIIRLETKDPTEILDKVESYLASGYEFRKNVITGKIELRGEADVKHEALTDYWVHSQLRKMRKIGIKITKERMNEVLDSDFVPKHDPIKAYFEGLPEWKAGDRDYITDYVELLPHDEDLDDGKHNSKEVQHAIFKMIIEKWMIGAVAGALDHKPNHIMLILQGGQGIGKTTYLRHLCPVELRQDYYHEGSISDDKDVKLIIARSFMVVDDELESMTKKQHESIKAIITSDTMRLRSPYDKYEQTYARRCSFAGSVNRRTFLNDETGSRRFPVIPVGGNIDITAIRQFDIDGLWSQVVAYYREGKRYWFDDREIQKINDWNKHFEVLSQYDDLVDKYITHKPGAEGSHIPFLTTSEVASQLANRVFDEEKITLSINDKFTYGLGRALAKANIPRVAKKLTTGTRRGYNVIVAPKNSQHSPFTPAEGEW